MSQLPRFGFVLFILLPFLATGCTANRKPASPAISSGSMMQKGMASWYGPNFHGRRTASGERYNMHAFTAAHPTLPFGTKLEVRNARTGQEVLVRINDRGPFKASRIIDLSYAAAQAVGLVGPGTGLVELYPASNAGNPVLLQPTGGDDTRYTVQVGAFSEPELALKLHHELVGMYPETSLHADGTWNRVQIGTFAARDEAESLRRELAIIGLSSVVVAAH